MTEKHKSSGTESRKIEKPANKAAPCGDGRRRTLRTMLIGGGIVAGSQAMPASWSRPVVQSVLLPAHAQTSIEMLSDGEFINSSGAVLIEDVTAIEPDSSVLYAIVRTLVPEARAQNGPCNLVIQNACAFVANGEITARVTLRCRAKEVPDKNPQKAIKGGCFVDEDLEACFEATGPAEVGTNLSVSLEFEGKDYEKGEGCCEDLHVQVRGSADNPVLRVRCPTLGGVELPLSEGSCPPCNSSA